MKYFIAHEFFVTVGREFQGIYSVKIAFLLFGFFNSFSYGFFFFSWRRPLEGERGKEVEVTNTVLRAR
jgi:hypothetical protein